MFASINNRAAVRSTRLLYGVSALVFLVACDDAGNFDTRGLFSAGENAETTASDTPQVSESVEKDVEAPDVFYAKEAGLWDGRPSLGGVWVAHPDVGQPEKVMIRNNSNGQFVIGALFRRERANPGPRLQLSSDAAQAIGALAGAPVELEVVALIKQKVAVEQPPEDVAAPIEEPDEIQQTSLDPIAAAEAAIETAPETQVEAEAVAAGASAASAPASADLPVSDSEPESTSAITSTLPETSLEKSYIQVGIFSVEANAETASNQMSRAGLSPTVREEGSSEQPSWRVIVGPASSSEELDDMLDSVKSAGFSDAYAVSN